MKLTIALFFLATIVSTNAFEKKSHEPERPVWAPQYTVAFNFTVPYVSKYQKDGLVYTYQAYQDYANAKQKIVRDGVETVIIDVLADVMYEISPAEDTYVCFRAEVSEESGPTRRRLAMSSTTPDFSKNTALYADDDETPQNYLGFVLPDLSEERWTYKATTHEYKRDGLQITAHEWIWDLTEGDMEMKYTFYTTIDGQPLELNMVGINLYTGGHKDNYIATYYDYVPLQHGEFPADMFTPPVDLNCSQEEPELVLHRSASLQRVSHAFRAAAPNTHWGDTEYDVFVHKYGRRHKSTYEYTTRRNYYKKNIEFITKWNSENVENRRHRLGINTFVDWSDFEYRQLLGLRRQSKENLTKAVTAYDVATLANFTELMDGNKDLPTHVFWETIVKDQAACGSCWAFSAIASLESAVYRTTGKNVLLSQQELMDCSWVESGNTGCFGGEQDRAISWVLSRGGVAPLDEYEYRGVNDFCRKNVTRVPIKGRLAVVQGGERALQAALLTQGPMAVSVDAEADEFRFYAGGLYFNPECATEASDLNHAVVANGYGIDEETGTEYWIVSNIWSPYWGENGYIRIARSPNDCGIATQPLYVATD